MFKKLWRKFKRFITRDYATPVNDYGSHGEGTDFTPSWGIIVPHTKVAQGAMHPMGLSEYEYGLDLVNQLKKPFETRDNGGVRGAAKRLVNKGCNASLEPHKNAYNGKAEGFELLIIKGDKLSERYALMIVEAFKAKYPSHRIRQGNGIKYLSSGDRGAGNLVAAKAAGMEVAILSESFFIDNPKDFIDVTEMASFWKENLVNG